MRARFRKPKPGKFLPARPCESSIGFQDLPQAPLEPEILETVDKGDYVREKILLHTTPWTVMPVYILKPKNSPPTLPLVIAFHGHGYGVKDIVGLWENGEERETSRWLPQRLWGSAVPAWIYGGSA